MDYQARLAYQLNDLLFHVHIQVHRMQIWILAKGYMMPFTKGQSNLNVKSVNINSLLKFHLAEVFSMNQPRKEFRLF